MTKKAEPKNDLNLEYRARLETKKHFNAVAGLTPIPVNASNCKGIFFGVSVVITEKEAIREIYANGNYGKGSHSRGVPAFQKNERKQVETLVLQLEEAFFLAYFVGILQIQGLDGNFINWEKYIETVNGINLAFVDSFAVYLYLKSKGWVVKSGLKFGGDFTIYKIGPEYYHASFVVHIINSNESLLLAHKNLKGLQRVADTSNKDVLLLEVTKPELFELRTLADFQSLSISETIVRRIKLSSFVQCPNVNKQ